MINILYVNSCISRDTGSRTGHLAQAYLKKRLKNQDCRLLSVVLENSILPPLSGEMLTERDRAIQTEDFSGTHFALARSFAAADEIVIAAPYWDMSFPALLKLYVEQICINKLTFCYNEKGMPCGLTRIKKAVYITTAGGFIGNNNFGFDYIKGVFTTLFGIADITFFSAEGLDICGSEPEKILADSIEKMYSSMK